MRTFELERLLKDDFKELSSREEQIAYKSAQLYRDHLYSHWNELREKAAISAMQGYIESGSALSSTYSDVAKWSVEQADALIEELKKEK